MAVGKREAFILIKGTFIRTCNLYNFIYFILTILGWRTFDAQGSYTERGRPMTTGAQEVTTVDELQFRFVGGGGVVGGPLTLSGRTLRGDAR